MCSEDDLILCEDGHCLIYKRKVHHRGPAFDNPNVFSLQRGANQDLDAYITKGDYDRTRPQEKGSTSGRETISGLKPEHSSCYMSEAYIKPRANLSVFSGPNFQSVARPGGGKTVSRPPSTSEMEKSKK